MRRRLHPAQLHQFDPLRTANWRSARAMSLLAASPPGRPSTHDDQYVVEIYRFLKRKQASRDGGVSELFPEYPGLWYAYQLYNESGETTRGVIEARILAGQTNNEIAEYYGTLPDTIEYYEAAFFSVRDRLKQKDWILRQIYGPNAENITAKEKTTLLQLFAYHGGVKLLELLLSGFDSENNIQDTTTDGFLDRHVATTLRHRAATGLMTTEINRYNITELLNTHTKLVELRMESQAAKDLGKPSAVQDNILGLLQQISWLVGSGQDVKSTITTTPAGPFAESAVQLRADQELALALGSVSIEDMQDRIVKTLPPPRTVNDGTTKPAE